MPTFTMMIGFPASGKSTVAEHICQNTGALHVSSDAIRQEVYENVNDNDHNMQVFDIMQKRTKEALSAGRSVVYDATNLSHKRRIGFLQDISKIQCEKKAIVMATPYDECVARNEKRDRVVPIHVLEKMRLGFHIPYTYEGWDDIIIRYSDNCGIMYSDEFIKSTMQTDQNNRHHTASLGQHCYLTEQGVVCYNDTILRDAARLHDVGKLYTKTFFDDSKDPDEAHYYSHNNVGAYECLFYDIDNPLEVSILIQWHMMPYQWGKDNNTKLMEKYRKLWGEELFSKIMLLHEADKNAH